MCVCAYNFLHYTYNFLLYTQIGLRNTSTDLQQMIDGELKREIMNGNNKVNCPHCEKKTISTKQMVITHAPSILNVTIKLFDNFGDKILRNVYIQKEIQLNDGVHTYLLLSAIIHIGNKSRSGHYITIGRSIADCRKAWSIRKTNPKTYVEYGRWIYCNDQMKRVMKLKEVNNILLTKIPQNQRNGNCNPLSVYNVTYLKTSNNKDVVFVSRSLTSIPIPNYPTLPQANLGGDEAKDGLDETQTEEASHSEHQISSSSNQNSNHKNQYPQINGEECNDYENNNDEVQSTQNKEQHDWDFLDNDIDQNMYDDEQQYIEQELSSALGYDTAENNSYLIESDIENALRLHAQNDDESYSNHEPEGVDCDGDVVMNDKSDSNQDNEQSTTPNLSLPDLNEL